METARTVFVVDDDRNCREAIRAIAETLGAAVLPFGSGEEFLAQCTPEQAGCVVLDVRMPGMTGHEVYEAMQARNMTQPVVMVTAHGDIPMAVRAIQQGVFAFFEKPCRGQDLWESLRSALAYDERVRAETSRVRTIQERLSALGGDERRVMEMMLRNVPSKTIAKRLGISIRTVQVRRTAVFDRMGADSIASLATMIEMLRAHEASNGSRLRMPVPQSSLSPAAALAHSF
ncbi:MAG TPA: response regulator [Pirellulales bacterium]|nr:response regulator [Pirellulales bacterium]